MAKKSGSSKVKDGSLKAVPEVTGATEPAAQPLGKKAAKELRKLEAKLVRAKGVEAKRLKQLAAAEKANRRKEIDKRGRQAAEAASTKAAISARIAELTPAPAAKPAAAKPTTTRRTPAAKPAAAKPATSSRRSLRPATEPDAGPST